MPTPPATHTCWRRWRPRVVLIEAAGWESWEGTLLGADYLFASDFNREASTAFGVLRESPLGPGLRNASDRAAFVIGRDGAIRYAWHSTNPSLLPPFDEIKQAVAEAAQPVRSA